MVDLLCLKLLWASRSWAESSPGFCGHVARPAQLSGCPWAACSTRLILYWLLSKQINLSSVELCSTSQQSPLICFHYSILSVVSNLCSPNLKDSHFTSPFCRNWFSGKLINTFCQTLTLFYATKFVLKATQTLWDLRTRFKNYSSSFTWTF